MLTRKQINDFGAMLDCEYETTIKPILKESRENLIKLFNPVLNDEYNKMCDRNNFGHFKFGYVPSDIWGQISALGVYETNAQICFNCVCDGLVGFCGYSTSVYRMGIVSVLSTLGDAKAISIITEIKKRFEMIKSCYLRVFVEKDGWMVKRLIDTISTHYDNVKNKDEESDRELFSLFGVKPSKKSFKITVKIEEN